MNLLQHEKSPYLLQHAANPVQWYPWGRDAFLRAETEDKPVFLSIGYSTCHWCHVMAHESFEDQMVAQALNQNFIAVKVDREERPDIDAVYMDVCQSLTGSGGWPLTIIMTPEQKPFFAGTYLPKTSRFGETGLLELLETVSTAWQNDRAQLLAAGEEITQALRSAAAQPVPFGNPSWAFLQQAAELYQRRYDSAWGGFGAAPKFPSAHHLLFLLNYSRQSGDSTAGAMAEHTLQQMYRGGIFDHIGGGFSRYATDKRWLVPHFEKMLYDNALLADSYLAACKLTGQPLYETITRRILDYVLSELTTADGAFICAQDADSQGVEGQYYLLDTAEILDLLGPLQGAEYNAWYGLTEEGHLDGLSIPNLLSNPDYAQTPDWFAEVQPRLYAYRRQRSVLHADGKVLTSWNGLMIAAMARAGFFLEEETYLQAALKAQRFIHDHLSAEDGRLFLRWFDGEAKYPGQLEDYAYYGLALLALYEATWEVTYLSQAMALTRWIFTLFADEHQGGFFLYASDSEALISRPKEAYDGALPSGNAACALLLTRLAHLTGDSVFREAAFQQLGYLTGALAHYPAGSAYALQAILETLAPAPLIICTTSEDKLSSAAQALLRKQRQPLAVLVKTPANAQSLAECIPALRDYPLPAAGEAYYLCKNGSCQAPVDTVQGLSALLTDL